MAGCRVVLLLLSTVVCAVAQSQVPQVPDPSQTKSYVQGYGIGQVSIKPDTYRLSVPIKIVMEDSWQATEKLREVRKQIVERATEMGAPEEDIRTIGFQCVPAGQQQIVPRGQTRKAEFAARCYVVVDLPMQSTEDNEETVAIGSAHLEQLAELVPKPESVRRLSYSSYISSTTGLSSQHLEQPSAFYVARVSEQDRAQVYQQAFEQAKEQVGLALKAMDLNVEPSLSVHQQGTTVLSSRRKHPLEAEIYRKSPDEVVGMYAEGVALTTRVTVSARFNVE